MDIQTEALAAVGDDNYGFLGLLNRNPHTDAPILDEGVTPLGEPPVIVAENLMPQQWDSVLLTPEQLERQRILSEYIQIPAPYQEQGFPLFNAMDPIYPSMQVGEPNALVLETIGFKEDMPNLAPVGDYNLSLDFQPEYGNTAYLNKDAAEAFLMMNEDFKRDSGVGITLESAYRSPEHNAMLPNASSESLHLEGMSIDVVDPAAKEWLIINGPRYGWFFSDYPGSNHFNFIPGQSI